VEEVFRRVADSLRHGPHPTDHLISVDTLLALRAARPGTPVEDACQRWASSVLDAARPVSGRPRVHRPDHRPWQDTIWVDCMHTDGPGLAALGYLSEALEYAEEYAAVLQRDDGLFQHGYDVGTGRGNDVAWGRGQAWALLGMLGTLEAADDDRLRRRLQRLVQALALHEDEGQWRTVLDDPAAPVENSVASYVAWAVPHALDRGLLDPEYAPMAERAWQTTVSRLVDGALTCSAATPIGEPEAYVRQSTGVFPWGQAPVVHALVDRIDREDGFGVR
jgi:rhamnogalacturonyl hydrolase YesR